MLQSTAVYALRPDGTDTGSFQITTPGTLTGVWVKDLVGMSSVAVDLRFAWGSGGQSVNALLQSAMGPDGQPYDVAQVTFTTAARAVLFELFGGTNGFIAPGAGGMDSTGIPTAEGFLCPVLGDRLRLLLVVDGTYVNTTLTALVSPK
jgi:hypothetical protein